MERFLVCFQVSEKMKLTKQASWLVITIVLLFSTTQVDADILTPGRFTQHEYERFDNYSMTYDAARTACQFRRANLDLPVLSTEEIHYRTPDVLSVLRDVWYWAPMQREVRGVWRWWNGSQVDVSDHDKKALRTNDVITKTSCAAWNLTSGYVPETCDQGHSFLCLTNTTATCRLRTYGYSYEFFGIMWNETNYPVYDSMSDILKHFQALKTQHKPALYRESQVNVAFSCYKLCNKIHLGDLSFGCWFAQFQPAEAGGGGGGSKEGGGGGGWVGKACLMLLATALPTTPLLPVAPLNGTRLWFRSCFRQYSSTKNSTCALQCGCRDQGAPTTMAEAVAEEKRIKSQLTLPTANLSATVRRKTSVMDARPSAQAVGVVGVGVIGSLLALVVILDLTSLRRDLRMLMTNIKALPVVRQK